jgi:hypothetical protein
VLRRHREVLDRCVQALLARETLDEAELRALALPLTPAQATARGEEPPSALKAAAPLHP